MATPASANASLPSSFLNAAAWSFTVLSCLYFVFALVELSRFTKIMAGMFASIGVELPLGCRIIVGAYALVYPALFGTATILVVIKEFFIRDKKFSLAVTWIIASSIFGIVSFIHEALYSPLFGLVEKLSK